MTTLRTSGFLLTASCLIVASSVQSVRAVDFERDIAELLVTRCLECHNQREKAGGLSLHSEAAMGAGGDSGEVVMLGDANQSELIRRIESTDDDRMPPDDRGVARPLPDEEKQLLRKWIDGQAKWPQGRQLSLFERTTSRRAGRDWWSLQPIEKPQPPKVAAAENPIDAFVIAQLDERGWRLAPLASRRTRLRRIYIDMTGAPPTFDEIQAFLADKRPDAWERVVDRLLASPRYGQRWTRYWLDLARYADTSGYERDQTKPFAWRYRDWVVDRLNADYPYDRFMVEQVAGDQLPDRTRDTVIATGFLRLGTWNDEPNDPQDYKYERLEDLVHTTSTAFLGLTVKCARCHDHKFDPIPQLDYYRMASIFWPGPIEPRQRELLGGPSADELGEKDVLGWTDLKQPARDFFLLKNGDRHKPAGKVAPASLTMVSGFAHDFEPANQRLQFAKWLSDPKNPLPSRVIVNRLWLHHFGAGLVRTPNNFGFVGQPPTHPKLLDWLAAELRDNQWRLKPLHRLILTSRVYQQNSIHPEQDTYATSDSSNMLWWRANRRRLDAEALRDSLLAVTGDLDERRGGAGFRPVISPEATEGLSRKASAWTPSPALEQHRRSLYLFAQRSLLPPLMTTFDFADSTLPCGQRNSTTVAPQALAMMNHRFQHERSEALANLIRGQANKDADRLKLLWRTALARRPNAAELAACDGYLKSQRLRFERNVREQQPNLAAKEFKGRVDQLVWASLSQVVLSSNEFLYVD